MIKKQRSSLLIAASRAFIGAALAVVLMNPMAARAFTSISSQTVTAVAVMGGFIFEEIFEIEHAPLRGFSLSNKMIIIQGGVGKDVPAGFAPNYQQSPLSAQALGGEASGTLMVGCREEGPVEITVFYRFVSFPDEEVLPTVIGPCFGPDPLPFGVQVDPAEVDLNRGKIFQYRIEAKKTVVRLGEPLLRHIASPTDFSWHSLNPAHAPVVITQAGGRVVIPQGNPNVADSIIEVPRGVFKAPTTLNVVDQPFDQLPAGLVDGLTAPAAVYQIDASPSTKGPFKMVLGYPDFQFPVGQVGKLGASDIPEQDGMVYGWDGFRWRKLGGKGDFAANSFTVNAAYYPYVAIAFGNKMLALEKRADRKIITPNNDTHNDIATFGNGLDSVTIFDSSMHKVKTITDCRGTPSMLCWDGTDANGKVVESGVYIYQYTSDGERISGVIGVAK
jgi:hypothetical protein